MPPGGLPLLQLRRLVAPEAAAQAELACQAEREALAGTPPPHSPLPMQGEAGGRACLPWAGLALLAALTQVRPSRLLSACSQQLG